MRRCLAAAALAVVVSCAAFAEGFDPQSRVIGCSGPFAKNSNHARVVEAFGKQNVTYLTGAQTREGDLPHTAIFPSDPKNRLLIFWDNEQKRSTVASIVVRDGSQWTAAKGIRLGATLADVEKANGKPFRITGFTGIFGGLASAGWQGGALSLKAAGCSPGVHFEADPAASKEVMAKAKTKIESPKVFQSSDPAMQAIKPRVTHIYVGYNE